MNIRKVGLTTLFVMLVAALGLQIHAGQTASQSGTTRPAPSLTGLQNALGLTAAQVSQLQSLIQSQQSSIQSLVASLRTAQQALQTALKGTDGTAISTANQAVQTAQTALSNAQKSDQQALLAVLMPTQQQIITDYLLIAQNGGPGPFGVGPGGLGPRGGFDGPGPQFRGGPRPQ